MGRSALVSAFALIIACVQMCRADPSQRIYIAAEDIDWNYAPQGTNVCKNLTWDESGAAALWGSAGLGSTLKKAKFVAYTDDTFTTKSEIPADEVHLGLLGPLIRATPGDQIEAVLKNDVDFDLLLDPQGLIPLNVDNAPSPLGPVAEPGETVTYTWDVPEEAAPGPEDPDTKLYLYRSVVYPEASDNAGLIGPILVSRKGAPAKPEQGRDIITIMQILDENVSPYYGANVGNNTYEDLGLESEYALEESLLKHAVNGFVFCNGPGFNMSLNENVRWHSAAMGSEGDMHNSHWHGSTFLRQGYRGDQVKMFPGSTLSMDFTPREAGTWLLHCHVNDHIHGGMMALYNVAPNSTFSESTNNNGTARKYYIAVDEVDWNYAPLGGDACSTGKPEQWSNSAIPFIEVATGLAGPRYLKAQYNEYTDDSFTTKVARGEDEAYLGILGPIIRAEVGDTIDIVFRNNLKSLNKSVSIHPHGVAYNKSAEGAFYQDGTTGTDRLDDMVAPNTTLSFAWQVPETAGPGPNDPSTIGWMYHSHADEVADPLAGLVGMLVIGRPGSMETLNTSTSAAGGSNKLGAAKDVDKEVFYLFSVMNERGSFMWPLNLAAIEKRDAAVAESWLQSGDAAAATPAPGGRKLLQQAPMESLMAMAETEEVENDLMHGINGYVFCNGPAQKISRGDNVRFHVMAIGTEVDMHSATLAGSNFDTDGQRGPAVGLLPGSMETSDVAVVAPAGRAVLGCRVADHVEAGMSTLIDVEDPVSNVSIRAATTTTPSLNTTATAITPAANATERTYFIQAEETLWDYGPKGRNFCGAEGPEPFTDGEALFMEQVPGETIGSTYTKAVYRRFANKNFIQRIGSPIEFGILGPVIAAEVGDIIEIYFKNTLSFEVNLKFDAGFVPLPGSADVNAEVPTGETVKYILFVPESAGPGPSDLNTVTYGYTSSVDPVYHPYSGLIGICLIGSKGAFAGLNPAAMPAEPVPAGVDKMLPLLIAVMNEGETVYLEKNADNAGVDLSGSRRRLFQAAAEAEAAAAVSPDFEESNLMHAINGYMFCNMPEIHIETGKTIRVATLGMGSEVDLHSIVFAGQSLVEGGKSPRGSIEPIMPASGMSANLNATQPGKWVFECLIHDHSEAGMRAMLSVDTPEETKALAMGSSAMRAGFGFSSLISSLFAAVYVAVFITQLFG